jgi:hypothetical protein
MGGAIALVAPDGGSASAGDGVSREHHRLGQSARATMARPSACVQPVLRPDAAGLEPCDKLARYGCRPGSTQVG